MSGKVYDGSFFDYSDRISAGSARRIVPIVQDLIPGISSVVDFGCARGVWLGVWQECGASEIAGLDGNYIDRNNLRIPLEAFITHDLTGSIDLNRKFDLVQSLEVAEHLPEQCALQFVETLTRHGDIVLFSAAPPGQGGANHINERPYEYWRDIFSGMEYSLFDCLRPRIQGNKKLQAWYRFNSFIFVHKSRISSLTSEVRATGIPQDAPIPDVSPLSFRLRKSIVRTLPRPAHNLVASAVGRIRGY